jgi:hypothetical protein
MVGSEDQRQQMIARDLYVDVQGGEQLRRAIVGKLDSMVRQDALIGQIAQARPDAGLGDPSQPRKRLVDPLGTWTGLQLRASAMQRDTTQPDFAQRVQQALLDAGRRRSRPRPVGARPGHLGMTMLQKQLALQDGPVTPAQRERIDNHPAEGVRLLGQAGITDSIWLGAVQHHHAGSPSPLSALSVETQLARPVERSDIFSARLSSRKRRRAMSATAAAKAAYLDENNQPDEAGSAVIKAPGSLVRLGSGEVAVVVRRGRQANEPGVLSVVSASGTPLGVPASRNTRLKPHGVTGGVAPHEVNLRLSMQTLINSA